MTAATQTFQEMARQMGRRPGQNIERHTSAAQPVMASPETPGSIHAASRSFARIVLAISSVLVIVACLILTTVWLVGDGIARAGHSPDTSLRQRIVGNDVLNVPANMIRFRSQRRNTSLERLDLYMLWPQMQGYTNETAEHFNQPQVNAEILFVTVEPRRMSQDMSGRMEPIYSKFFTGEREPAGHGLMKQPLDPSGGFADEELWFEADSPYAYAARCIRNGAQRITHYCLRDIHLGKDLTVTYRFHKSLIGQWMALEAGVRTRLNSMLAH